MKLNLKDDTLHFIGIAGTGMAPLAELASKRGFRVQGSDASVSEHSKENLKSATCIIVSSAIAESNEELLFAKKSNLPIYHRSDLLKFFMDNKRSITVAGTHGKTSTTAMIGHMLAKLNQDPTVILGGRYVENDQSLLYGKSDLFVAEADESDRTFLKYEPFISVLTSIDNDHLDVYTNLENLRAAFLQYLSATHVDGCCVVGWDDQNVRDVVEQVRKNKLTFGFFMGSEVRCFDYKIENGKLFFKAVVEHDQVSCTMSSLGKHSVQNALATLATARVLGLNVKEAAESLESFKGVQRRLNITDVSKTFCVIDDYAHNPGKIKASIAATKEAYPDRKLIVVFQPHRYSRLRTMYQETLDAFSQSDLVITLPVYSAGETVDERFTSKTIANDLQVRQKLHSIFTNSFEEAVNEVELNIEDKTVCLTIGAGDVWKVGKHLLENAHGSTQISKGKAP